MAPAGHVQSTAVYISSRADQMPRVISCTPRQLPVGRILFLCPGDPFKKLLRHCQLRILYILTYDVRASYLWSLSPFKHSSLVIWSDFTCAQHTQKYLCTSLMSINHRSQSHIHVTGAESLLYHHPCERCYGLISCPVPVKRITTVPSFCRTSLLSPSIYFYL